MQKKNKDHAGRENGMTRRRFTIDAALAALGGATLTIACGDSGPTTPSPTAPSQVPPTPTGLQPGDRAGTVSSNTGHQAVITAAQLSAGGALTLDITGTSDHPHSLSLTAAEVGQIAAGQRLEKDCTVVFSHTHRVTFNA